MDEEEEWVMERMIKELDMMLILQQLAIVMVVLKNETIYLSRKKRMKLYNMAKIVLNFGRENDKQIINHYEFMANN